METWSAPKSEIFRHQEKPQEEKALISCDSMVKTQTHRASRLYKAQIKHNGFHVQAQNP